MGNIEFYVQNPKDDNSVIIPQIELNTGFELTWIDAKLLDELGIERKKEGVKIQTGPTDVIERSIGYAVLMVSNGESLFETIVEVVFAETNDPKILGRRALEGLRLRLDSKTKRISPNPNMPIACPSQDIAIAIGYLCMNFEGLDLVISAIVSRLITHNSKIGAIITSEMSNRNLVHALLSIIRQTYGIENKLYMQIDKMMAKFRELQEYRNKTLHSAYAIQPMKADAALTQLKTTAKSSSGLKTQARQIDQDEIWLKINDAGRLMIELEQMFQEMFPGETLTLA